jgi:hypothetical protein
LIDHSQVKENCRDEECQNDSGIDEFPFEELRVSRPINEVVCGVVSTNHASSFRNPNGIAQVPDERRDGTVHPNL